MGDASTFGCLAPAHEDLVRKYLKFVRSKRDIALKSMEDELNDYNNDRLSDDMYSQDDVEGLLNGIRGYVVTNLRQEVGAVTNMSALLMKQMLEDAEQQGAALTIDTGTVEDQALLDEVERLRVDGHVGRKSGQASRLVSIKDELARLEDEGQSARLQNEELEGRLARLQEDCNALRRERDDDRAEAAVLRRKLRSQSDNKGEPRMNGDQGRKDTGEMEGAQREIAALKEASERRLNESPQFQQLKRLVASKSKQVVTLRRRLARYEPDDEDGKHEEINEEEHKV